MYAPRVFVSMICALAVFAIATYFLTGSLATTLIETAICAVLLQVGYFVGVLYLVWKAAMAKNSSTWANGTSLAARFWRATHVHRAALVDDKAASMQTRDDDKGAGLPAPTLNRPDPFNR